MFFPDQKVVKSQFCSYLLYVENEFQKLNVIRKLLTSVKTIFCLIETGNTQGFTLKSLKPKDLNESKISRVLYTIIYLSVCGKLKFLAEYVLDQWLENTMHFKNVQMGQSMEYSFPVALLNKRWRENSSVVCLNVFCESAWILCLMGEVHDLPGL